MKKKLKIILSCLLIVVLCFVIFHLIYTPQNQQFQSYIDNLIDETDRVEFVYDWWSKSPEKHNFSGENMKEFMICLEFNFPHKEELCKCMGNPSVNFYSKDKLLAQFTVHHNNCIRSKKFPVGNIHFTPEGQKRYMTFLSKHNLKDRQ